MTRAAGAPGTAGHAFRDLVHISDEDCTEARRPTDAQARAVALLELNPHGTEFVRLSRAQWAHVDRVVTALGALGVPAPRSGER